jgi:PAS domain S-box-containing protein
MADDRRHRVLVVDDNPATRYSTGRVLRGANFDVNEAATGNEAIASARQTPDLVILDVNLPDIDGFEVCRRLRAMPDTARTPVIHLSATFVKDDDKVHGLQAGADGYLTHPVEPPVLIATVNAFLRAREAEEAMRTSEAKFKAVFENAVNGIALLTDGLIYFEANPAMAATLGLDRSDILGKHVSAFLPSGSEEILHEVDSSLRSSGVWRGTIPVLHADGRSVELEWSVSIHSEPATRLAVTTDISERRAIEAERERLLASERLARAEAERANRLKDDFLAAISHELRTPLNAILGWAHVMELQKPPATMTPGLEAINRNVRVLAQMIADLLDVSRITTGKLRLDLQAFDPVPTLEALIAGFAPAAAAKSIEITSRVDRDAGQLVWDLARFQQVVSNLLDNAIKFSSPSGRIALDTSATSQDMTLSIRDEGRGIAPEFVPHVFDRFRQEDAGTTRRYGGLGLGLAIVKQLVEAHSGTISVHSAGEGAGTTFTVHMPRLPLPAIDAGTGNPLEHHSLSGVRVLVLDDDDDARELAGRILGEFGATVQPCSSVRDAKLLLENFQPDLIFSDISMPGEDGYEFIRFLRGPESPAPDVPAIALTAFGSESDRAQLLGIGYQLHLAKPFEPLKLVESAVDQMRKSSAARH